MRTPAEQILVEYYLFKQVDCVDAIAFSELRRNYHGEVGQEQNLQQS
jgi:hypothetical protein